MLKSNINWKSPAMRRHGQSIRDRILEAYLSIRRAYDPQKQEKTKASETETYKKVADKYRN